MDSDNVSVDANGYENPGGEGGTTGGTHTFGVLWTTTGVTFVYDGAVVGTETALLSGAMFIVIKNSMGGPLLSRPPRSSVTCVSGTDRNRRQLRLHCTGPRPIPYGIADISNWQPSTQGAVLLDASALAGETDAA